jgi:hypothetical protein
MPVLWEFRCYVSVNGTDEIRRWYEAQRGQVQAKFLSRLKMLSTLPFSEWNENFHKALHGNCAGLNEIRFKAAKVQQRPLGFRSGKFEFTLLLCAKEKSNRFVPAKACEMALARKSEVQKDRSRTNALWLALE